MTDLFRKDRAIYAWVPTMLWAFVIAVFSLLPYNNIPPLTLNNFDKVLHFLEYSLLGFLIMRAFFRSSEMGPAKGAIFTLIMGGVYGILMELVQHFAPGRDVSFFDAVSNIAGVTFGIALGKALIWQK